MLGEISEHLREFLRVTYVGAENADVAQEQVRRTHRERRSSRGPIDYDSRAGIERALITRKAGSRRTIKCEVETAGLAREGFAPFSVAVVEPCATPSARALAGVVSEPLVT